MKTNVECMLDNLAPEIDLKCNELRAAKKERLKNRLFVILCAMVLLIPALLVLFGVSLTMLIAPLAFMSLSMLLLLPVLLSGRLSDESDRINQKGAFYEQA